MFAKKPPEFMQKDITTLPPAKGSWSFSALSSFEALPYRFFVESRLKHRGEQHPAALRGENVHKSIEDYIMGLTNDKPNDPKIGAWQPEFQKWRDLYSEGNDIQLEGDWAFNTDWTPVEWMAQDAWLRAKLDLLYLQNKTSAHVVDWKTGRKFGNEMKHQQQGILYAISAFMRFPELEFARVEFLYLDQPYRSNLEHTYTREQALLFEPGFVRRVNKMLTAELKDFAPPMTLDGLPKYQQDWLRDPANYGHDNNPFDPPFYVDRL